MFCQFYSHPEAFELSFPKRIERTDDTLYGAFWIAKCGINFSLQIQAAGLCKFVQNISTNIWRLGKRACRKCLDCLSPVLPFFLGGGGRGEGEGTATRRLTEWFRRKNWLPCYWRVRQEFSRHVPGKKATTTTTKQGTKQRSTCSKSNL